MTVDPQQSAYDVVVVGAGVIGLACAWRAAQRGLGVLVLDREAPAAGASGVAAGMLAPVTEAEFGEQALLGLTLAGAARWPAFDAELSARSGADTGYRESGALVVAADRDDAEALRRLLGFQRTLGLEVEWLTGRECRRLEPGLSPRVAGGIHAPGDHHVDPRATVAALARAFTREGGELVAPAPVRGLELGDDGAVAGVRLASGAVVSAGQVVLAAGSWTLELEGLPAEGVPPIRPVKGQILTLRAEGGPALATRLIRTPRCYVVCRADGRVVVGATVEERGFDLRVTGEGVFRLLEAAWEVLPDVGELEWVEARAGLRPGTPDNAPVIGPDALPGLIWATGHYRNGVLLAPLTAETVAELLVDGSPPAEVAGFGPERFAAPRRAARAAEARL